MRLLLDLDEVLCDFVGGVVRLWGLGLKDVQAAWEPGVWDVRLPLSRVLGLPELMSNDVFWERVNGREDFWDGLEPMPWADQLVDLVSRHTKDWHVISSPSYCPTCYSGKVKWLKRMFGYQFNRFALTPHKEIFAGPDVVLIDDSDANVRRFTCGPNGRITGGAGVVFPRLHNSNHGYVGMEIDYVQQTLTDLLSGSPS